MSQRESFKPSEVQLVGIPLTATFGRSEMEAAAAIIVRTCAVLGDEWRAVSVDEVKKVLQLEQAGDPLYPFLSNPFWNPDVSQLASAGFARWEGQPGSSPVGLTDAGIEKLRRWVRRMEATNA